MSMLLTDRDRALLDLAGREPGYALVGAFEQAVLEETGLSPTRFWQRINALLDEPAAWEYAPVVCGRLARLRRARRRSRATRGE